MKQAGFSYLLAALSILWMGLAISLYYLTHKPFSSVLAENLIEAAWNVLVGIAITLLSGGIGKKVLPQLEANELTAFGLQAAFGYGILSLGILLVGWVIGINALVAAFVVLILAALLWRDSLSWGRGIKQIAAARQSGGRLGRLIAAAIALLFVFSLLTALAPPLKFDSLVYHLALPLYYLADGAVRYIPENIYWGFPQMPHMLYLFGSSLGMTRPAVIGWMMGAVAMIGLVGYSKERASPRYGWIAAGTLLSGFSLASSLGWGYVDWPSILMGWAFLVCLDLWRNQRENKYLWLAGAFAGLAFGAKYTAGVLWLTGMGVLIWDRYRQKGDRGFKRFLPYLAGAAGLAAPWLLKNLIAVGNPFYPLIFPSGNMTTARLAHFQGEPIQGNWMDALLLPIRATYWGVELAHVGDGPGYEASLGPLLLGLGALGLLGLRSLPKPDRGYVGTAALIGLQGLVIWATAGRISGHLIRTHLYYSLFPSFAILAAGGFAWLEAVKIPNIRLGRISGVLLLLVLWLNVIQIGETSIRLGSPQLLAGLISEDDYLNNNLGMYNLAMRAVRELPLGSRVLMLWETRSYYCLPVCRPDETIDRWLDDLASVNAPVDLPDYWRSLGYTHLLFHRAGAEFIRNVDVRYTDGQWQALEEVAASLPVQIDFNQVYTLYSLNP